MEGESDFGLIGSIIIFLFLFALVTSKEAWVSEVWCRILRGGGWALTCLRTLNN